LASFPKRRIRWYVREWIAAILFLGAVAVGVLIYRSGPSSSTYVLKMTGGSFSGLRSRIAERLAAEASKQGVTLRLVETAGSNEALDLVERGLLDLAMVQGALDPSTHPHVRQVAALHVEPLHLLVKPELFEAVSESLVHLRGRTVNLSTPGSGTHDLALNVLRFVGLFPKRSDGTGDFVMQTASYRELEQREDRADLPDAVFTVSDLPSPLVRRLVSKHHYRLVPLKFGEAFALDAFSRDHAPASQFLPASGDRVTSHRIHSVVIPAFTYGFEPAVPPTPLETFGPRLLIVAHESTPPPAVRGVLEAVFSSEFAQVFRPPIDPAVLELAPEYPWHEGTEEFRSYHKPVLAGELIDLLEKGSSLMGAVAGACFFFWQWLRQHYRRKRELGFESYMVKVAAIEEQAIRQETDATLDLRELLRLQTELFRLKSGALSRFAEGKLEGEALISGFLAHVNAARDHLTRLILHERDNLENRASASQRSPEELWKEAVGSVDLPAAVPAIDPSREAMASVRDRLGSGADGA
jgi:TRAP-type uncharacterized transport system substrate-binding protein